MPGPLDGIRVFDLTRILAGPSCTQMLADLGADVIKIERAGAGDDTRQFAPPFMKDAAGNDTTESAYFHSANRNKRSVTLDIATPKGQEIARKLIAKSHVFVENFKTGGLAKYGLGYEQLAPEFPGLIYCSVTGFGHTGPYAKRPGYDLLIQGMSGFMSVTGEPDGLPMKSAIPVADLMAGMYAGVSINAALRHQAVTGEGQHIDIGMLDVMVAFSTIQGMNYLATGQNPPRLGNAHPNIVPYQVFRTSNGSILLAVANDEQFKRFCAIADLNHIPEDERFATNPKRLANRAELLPTLEAAIASKTSEFWLEQLEANNVSCGPINNLDQVFANEHVVARGMRVEMEHPAAGGATIPTIKSPMRFSKTPTSERRAPPMLGQHTDEVLGDMLDMSAADLASLRDEGII